MSHSHRDDHSLVEAIAQVEPVIEVAPPATALTNSEAARAAAAQRDAVATVAATANEQKFRGGGDEEASRAPGGEALGGDLEDARVAKTWCTRGAPAPLWTHHCDEKIWVGGGQYEGFGFAQTRTRGSWVSPAAGASGSLTVQHRGGWVGGRS